MRERTSSLALN